jgi:hypothetical protein
VDYKLVSDLVTVWPGVRIGFFGGTRVHGLINYVNAYRELHFSSRGTR